MEPLSMISTGLGTATSFFNIMNERANAEKDAETQQNYQLQLMGKQYEYNKKGMEEQFQHEKEMYEYTGPESKVRQLKNAGLNPGLIYGMGSGSGGVTGNITAPSVSGAGAPNVAASRANKIAATSMLLQLSKLESEIRVNESIAKSNEADAALKSGAETAKKGAETELIGQQTIGQSIQNKFNEINVYMADKTKDINIQKIETLANQAKIEMENEVQKLIQNKTKSAEDVATLQSKIDQYNANVKKTVAETINTQIRSYEAQQNIAESINKIAQGWVDKNLTVEQMKTELQKTLMNNNTTLDAVQLQSITNILSGLIKK